MKSQTRSIQWTDWSVGSHVPFIKSRLDASIGYAVLNGMYNMQYFLGNPQSFKRATLCPQDIENCACLLKKHPVNIYSHYPYLSNLAGSVDTLAWTGDESVDNKAMALISSIEHELEVSAKLKSMSNIQTGVVIHPGSYKKDRHLGHLKASETINKISFPVGSTLLLENCAGEGNKLCKTLEELATIIQNVVPDKRKHVKVCIDTAHIWGNGEYNISSVDGVEKLFYMFDKVFEPDTVRLIHLNDSCVPFSSRKDRHALLGTGYIWNKDMESLQYLIMKSEELKIPKVLETSPSDMTTIFDLQAFGDTLGSR